MGTFIPSGIHHILIGADHILCFSSAAAPRRNLGEAGENRDDVHRRSQPDAVVAALDLISPPARFIESAIALSIVFVGADNLIKGMGRDVRTWVALAFGLVHGFGFANVLREFGLPSEALGWSLFSFNVGVEIGQLAIVLLVASALAMLRRRSDVSGRRAAWAGSVFVMGTGADWFLERVCFPVAV